MEYTDFCGCIISIDQQSVKINYQVNKCGIVSDLMNANLNAWLSAKYVSIRPFKTYRFPDLNIFSNVEKFEYATPKWIMQNVEIENMKFMKMGTLVSLSFFFAIFAIFEGNF